MALKSIISQRLVRRPDGNRVPTVEILMNTRHVAELVERGELNAIKEAMEQSLAPGSQTFEQDLFRLYREGTITLDEALVNSDSPTNLSWLINNSQLTADTPTHEERRPSSPIIDFESTQPDGASFREFTLHMEEQDR